jgi:hypothetical protein
MKSLQKRSFTIMNQKFINTVFTTTLLAASLVVSSLQANATGFHEGLNNHGKTISSAKFYEVLAHTKMDHLGYNFGKPDEIQTLKDITGNSVGSVWVYRGAVQKDNSKQDAHFVIIDGKLQYATLSNAS